MTEMSNATFAQRMGHCYELAAKHLLEIARPDGDALARLVHGSIQSGDLERIGHAWVIHGDGRVYEPTTARMWEATPFLAFFNRRIEHTYSVEQVRRFIAETKHWGAWEETEYPTNDHRSEARAQ